MKMAFAVFLFLQADPKHRRVIIWSFTGYKSKDLFLLCVFLYLHI